MRLVFYLGFARSAPASVGDTQITQVACSRLAPSLDRFLAATCDVLKRVLIASVVDATERLLNLSTLLPIRVKPRSSVPRVGGSHDGRLIVAVSAPAVDGKATQAAAVALAGALGIKAYELELVRGATSRDKDFAFVSTDDDRIVQIQQRMQDLLALI